MTGNVDQDSKTEEPTEKKIRDALDKGNTPFSREAPIVGSMAGILLVLVLFAGDALRGISTSLARFLEQPSAWRLVEVEDGAALLSGVFGDAFVRLAPAFVVLVVMGVVASVMQSTPQFVLERIRPKLSKLSIAQGWKRLLGQQGFVEFAKAICKMFIVIGISAIILRSEYPSVISATHGEPAGVPDLVFGITTRLLAAMVAISILLAVGDVAWSRHNWHRQLKMTRQEVKDEHKQADGDPLVKSRLRSLAQNRTRKRMMAAVPQATIVIANPIHIAIALKFHRGQDEAPVVIAKGKNLIAQKIREVANAHEIPIVENKPLARSMFDVVEINQMIPEEFYKAVAEMIFYLSTRGKSASRL